MRINHNIPALRALHQLTKSNSRLDKTLERLSSGLRINHAADDAAGLAITQKMDTQVRGLEQANRNAMDGISLIQTAEGALNEVHSMLQRIRELSVQVSNGSYDATDRKSVQSEVEELQNEIQRISDSIEFNEMKLLNGEIDRRAFSTNKSIADIVSMSDTVGAGNYTFDVTQLASKTGDTGGNCTLFDENGKAKVGGKLNINGEQVEINIGETSEQVFSKIRDLCSRVDVSVTMRPAPPFANDSTLKFEMNQYGPKKLNVIGDLGLLTALGLDESQFNPNSDNVYTKTSADLSAGITSVGVGQVFINGVKVSFANGDKTNDIMAKLRSAEIPGCEFGLDTSGKSIIVYSEKPLTIEAASNSAADKAFETGLASLQTTTSDAVPANTAKTSAKEIDKSKTIPNNTNIKITIGATPAVVKALTISGPLDLSNESERESLIQQLNTAVTTTSPTPPTNTTFAYDEKTSKIVAYNTDGYKITITPDAAAVEAMGFKNGEVEFSKELGNLGKNVRVDTNSISYDDPATPNEVEGFPPGTTVSTKGKDIIFTSNNNFELKLASGDTVGEVTMNLLETGPLDLQIGANEGQFMQVRIQNLSPRALGITEINLSTPEGAQEAITVIDNAIETISSVRSKLGAYQNRLEHTIANLESASENMTSSLSRILDADMAKEMANYTKNNIISQAGTSMLAQANQRPQSLLQLLQG